MPVKLLVIDLDGTLLNTDKTISDCSIKTLNSCRDKGMKIVFATDRPVRTVRSFLNTISCDAIIYHNGAFIISDGKRLGTSHSVPIDDARRILAIMKERYSDKRLSIEIDDMLYANFDISKFWSNTKAMLSDFTDLPDVDADKIIIEVSSQGEYEEVLNLLTPELYGQMSDGKLCLIMNRNATKLNAIKTLSQHWGIYLTEMIAFGDDYNDIEIIMHCGIGVAMGNAIKEVKDSSDVVTDTNDRDGVAKYLIKNVL